jgi:hypothetical protein
MIHDMKWAPAKSSLHPRIFATVWDGHGLAQTAAAKETQTLPSIYAFCLKNTERHPGYPNSSGGYARNPGYTAEKSRESQKTGINLASCMGNAMSPGFSPGHCRAGGSCP